MKRTKKYAAFGVSSQKSFVVSRETIEQMRAEGMEAQPLLTEHEMIEEIRATVRYLPNALKIMQQMSPETYGGFHSTHLHAVGHIVAMALMIKNAQPLHQFEGEKGLLCRLLQEEGIDS